MAKVNKKGTFKQGNKVGIGNKSKRDVPAQKAERKFITSAIEHNLQKMMYDKNGKNPSKYIDVIVMRMVKIAALGKAADAVRAFREIVDRVEGKAAQAIELTGRDKGPIQMITKEMSDAEAARIVQGMLRRSQGEEE